MRCPRCDVELEPNGDCLNGCDRRELEAKESAAHARLELIISLLTEIRDLLKGKRESKTKNRRPAA